MNAPLELLVAALGWALVHFVWQGALLGLVTALTLRLMRGMRPEHRYALACVSLLLCVAMPAAEALRRLHEAASVPAGLATMSAQAGGVMFDGDGSRLTWVQAHLRTIVGLWAICAALLVGRMVLGLLWVGRIGEQGVAAPDRQWQLRVTELAARFNIDRTVQLRVVAGVDSPFTAGWLRPVIVMPVALLTGLPPALLDALLAHEMAHIGRHDYVVNLLQNAVEAVLFYHPAVWWISGRIRIEREQIADDMAARVLGEPRSLALALSELDRFQATARQPALAANGGQLITRIRRLLRPDTSALSWRSALPVVILSAACVTACALGTSVLGEREHGAPLLAPTPAAPVFALPMQVASVAPPAAQAAAPVPAPAPIKSARHISKKKIAAPSVKIDASTSADVSPAPAPSAQTVVKASLDVRTCPVPAFPREAQRRNEQGMVVLSFLIGVDGVARSSSVWKSSGFPLLDQAALEAIGSCKFSPMTRGGKPTEGFARVAYEWKLDA